MPVFMPIPENIDSTFNPMYDVPTTDEQAKFALQRDDEITTQNLVGIYQTYRAEGKSVREAFKLTLEDHVYGNLKWPLKSEKWDGTQSVGSH